MKKLFFCLIGVLALSCKTPNTTHTLTEKEHVKPSEEKATVMPKEKSMKIEALESYFPDLPFSFYDNCNDEKGASEDYFKGKKIPNEVANQYKLYKLACIPKMGMKRRANSEDVEFRAIGKTKIEDDLLLIYTIGINTRTNDDNAAIGYETRIAVLKENKVVHNYFLGGKKRAEAGKDDSMTVCRLMEVIGNKAQFTLYKEASINIPSSLRLDDIEKKSID